MRFHKLFLVTLALVALVATGTALAERGDDGDRVSKNGAASGTIDGVDVSLEYGRPQVKGRTIWGGLVPYGEVWRTGANEATTITFGSDVMVEGEALPAGTYSLFTVPGEESWTVIFNKTAQQWGAYDYDESQDALRVSVTPRDHEMVEEMDFAVEDGEVVLMWAELAVPFRVEAG